MCIVHFFLSTVDLGLIRRLYISYSISTNKLKKNLIKKNLHANVGLKRTDGHGRLSIWVLNGRPNPLVHLVRQPCLCMVIEVEDIEIDGCWL